jgi:hypothetical protein
MNYLEPVDPKFGFWEVRGRKYRNKLQAVTAAVPAGTWPHFNFNDDVFGRYNWSQCPTAELKTLYQHRARSLRQNYDFVSIDFSGGPDSWNAAFSFLSAGLHIDMLVHRLDVNSSQSIFDKSASNVPAEAKFQAWPWFQKFKELDPTMTWHTQEITELMKKGWSNHVLDPLEYNNLHAGFISKFPHLVGESGPIKRSVGRSVSITGCDKPNLLFENGKFYLYFPDGVILHRGVIDRAAIDLPNDDVMFYWDPECCDLLCKQAHLVKDWFCANPHMLYLISDRSKRNNDLYYKIVNKLIYPDYQEIWQAKKPSGFNLMTHEAWFGEEHHQNTSYGKNWYQSVQNASDLIHSTLSGSVFEQFMEKENDYWHLSGSLSTLYYLGTL